MCLEVTRGSNDQVAEKDITVYKHLLPKDTPFITGTEHGANFTAIIMDHSCEGKISIQDGKFYFCHNNSSCMGNICSEKFGYRYSWVMDEAVKSVMINGKPLSQKEQLVTPYREIIVEIGETYTSELINENSEVKIGIHSFENLKDAFADSSRYSIFAECIIPKGSRYYKGTFLNMPSYASTAIKYNKIISREDVLRCVEE